MRIFITKRDTPTEPDALWRELLRRSGTASTTADLVKALNPHLNFDRHLAAGTVLLIPDAADLKAGAGVPLGGDALDDVLERVDTGLAAAAARAGARAAQIDADHTAVVASLKSAAAKRLVESDPALKKQLQAIDVRFKADQKRFADTESQLAETQKLAMEELGRLQKMLAG